MKLKRKVLIVDDDVSALNLLQEVLVRKGYDVLAFGDPSSALKELKTTNVDLVISDLMMPQMDGVRFMAMAMEIRPQVPVILITGHASVDSAVSAMQWGAFDYLKKPYDIRKIEEVVGRAMESGGLR